MVKIKYHTEKEKILDVPKCFCGTEPELVEDFDEIGNHRYRFVYIKCPYCNAKANKGHGYNTFNSYEQAVVKATEDWNKMVEGKYDM